MLQKVNKFGQYGELAFRRVYKILSSGLDIITRFMNIDSEFVSKAVFMYANSVQ